MAPTPIDRALNSKVFPPFFLISLGLVLLTFDLLPQNAFLAFSGLVVAVTTWAIMSPGNMLQEKEPKGNDPAEWTRHEMKRWLRVRGVEAEDGTPRAELEAKIRRLMEQATAAN